MRLRILSLLALCGMLAPTPSHAQDSAKVSSRRTADSSRRALDAKITIQVDEGDSTRVSQIEWPSRDRDRLLIRRRRTVAAGDTVRGDLVNLFGDSEVRGVVLGDAVVLFGDLTVHDGASILGDAVAVGGRVRVRGGKVGGNIVTSGQRHGEDYTWETDGTDASRADPDEPHSILGALFAVLVAMALLGVTGVIVAAVIPSRIDAVARRLEAGVGRAFAAGLIVELGFVPLLMLVILTLVITLLGILLIPFAVVAVPMLYAVLGALGWFATATLVGRGLGGRDGADRRAVMRSLAIGTVVLLLPFALAALLPGWGDGLLALAIGVVWVATTAGFGAAVLSRGGRPAR